MTDPTARYPPIEDYGVIGDLHTVALVGLDGSIDFLCFPYFDSPSVFAALLDRDRGGHFRISAILEDARHFQMYLPGTNVLLTRFLSGEGVAELSDLMPVEATGWAHSLVRRVKTVRGEVRYRMVCAPRFDYGRADHRVERHGDETLFVTDALTLRLRTKVPVEIRGGDAVAEFTLSAGEHASFVLERVQPGEDSPSASEAYTSEAFKGTVNYWRAWIARSSYTGRWRDAVDRSALVLKLLTSQRHGSLVAAPTFGLPEEIGGVRNWDYRYTWIRDSAFTLYGLLRLGFTEEAGAFFHWLEHTSERGSEVGPLQIMYGLDGRRHLPETELGHLEGYRGSRPVRIGNAAHGQLQLDIYGELLDAVYLYDKYGEPIHRDFWNRLVLMLDWVCEHWRDRDEGIWEVRGGRQEFLYSRLMCWVALDRGLRLARKRSLPAPVDRWLAERTAIDREIFERFWNEPRRTFVQTASGDALDASTLIMPLVRFVSPTDPRWLDTLRAIEHDLVDDSLVYRYNLHAGTRDGIEGGEGTFTMCSFWFVECLARAGRLEQARLYLDKVLGYANHVGLFAEELGPRGEHLGNFPQAFTHLALISAAYDLDRRLDAAGKRA